MQSVVDKPATSLLRNSLIRSAHPVGLGTRESVSGVSRADEQQTVRAIRAAFECGITWFDTSRTFGDGDGEVVLGKAIQPFRDRVVVITKPAPLDQVGSFSDPRWMRRQLEHSLLCLGTDWVDVLCIDPRSAAAPAVAEVAAEAAHLVKEGKARFVGVRSADEAIVSLVQEIVPVHVVQADYSLHNRDFEQTAEALISQGLTVLASSPLAGGSLATSPDLRGRRRRRGDEPTTLQEAVDNIAARHDATPAQIALAWVARHGVLPIPGISRVRHSRENARIASLRLGSDLSTLDSFTPTVHA